MSNTFPILVNRKPSEYTRLTGPHTLSVAPGKLSIMRYNQERYNSDRFLQFRDSYFLPIKERSNCSEESPS